MPDKVRLVRLEAPVWSLAEAINAGVLLARNSLLAKTDADILIAPGGRDAFDAMVSQLADGEYGLGVCQATDLHQSVGVEEALAAVLSGDAVPGRLRAKWGQGGLVFFSRETWDEVGGLDSRFTGWGNEDNDFAERVRRTGRRIRWADRDRLRIFHVWHPPSYAATGVISHRQRNQKIAKEDKSVLRSIVFRHSNFRTVAAPAVLQSVSPLVTLGIATTARPQRTRMLLEAINSFRGQIDNDFEILVVDNGSPDEEVAALETTLERISWTRSIRLEARPEPSIPAARNLIAQEARGRYICVVDDDDIALPNRLADHLRVFEGNGGLHGSHGGWIDFDESTGLIERNTGKHRSPAVLLRGTGKITAHPASFYRRDVMRAVPYDEAFALGSDLDLALRLSLLGFEIGHTGSYVTLRRYHSANVTITGQSNQVSNGATARSRALSTYAWNRLEALQEQAKAEDKELYCRNQLSLDRIIELLPPYVGTWQIFVPISALSKTSGSIAPLANAEGDHALQTVGAGSQATPDALNGGKQASSSDVPLALAEGQLQKLLEIIPCDICTRHSGLNQPIFFRSAPITGLKKARKLRRAIEDVVKAPVELASQRQAELDRSMPFNWKNLGIKPGERVLQSREFTDLSALLLSLARIDRRSLMGRVLSIMSDFTEQGEVYSAVTPSLKGQDQLKAFEFEIEQRTQLDFRQKAANGVASDLTPSSRVH